MLGVGVSCNVPGDGAGGAFESPHPTPAVYYTKVMWRGSQRQSGSEKTPCVRPYRNASTCELNVGSLEALGSFTWSRTEAPSPSPARPSACTRRGSLLELAPGWG